MSRGPGKWDRLIAEQLRQRVGFPLRQLWAWLDPPRGHWTEAEYQALYRAVQRWAARGECEVRLERDLAVNPHRPSDEDGRLQEQLFVYRRGCAPAEASRVVTEVDRVLVDVAFLGLAGGAGRRRSKRDGSLRHLAPGPTDEWGEPGDWGDWTDEWDEPDTALDAEGGA